MAIFSRKKKLNASQAKQVEFAQQQTQQQVQSQATASNQPDWFSLVNGSLSSIGCTPTKVYSQREFGTFANTVSPLGDAIQKIIDHVGHITPSLLNKNDNTYTSDGDVLKLLGKPNPWQTGSEFIQVLAKQLLVYGNAYYIITFSGLTPAAIYLAAPLTVDIEQDPNDGYALRYRVTMNTKVKTFNRAIDNGITYKADDDSVIVHLKEPGCDYGNKLYGVTRLNPLGSMLDLITQALLFNQSLLKNMGRPTTIVTPSDDNIAWTDQQKAEIQANFNEVYRGAQNAGGLITIPAGLRFETVSLPPSQLEWAGTIEMVTKSIYNLLNIPLALIGDASLSLANMETARHQFYTNAVIPMTNTLMDNLTRHLLPYYMSDDANVVISFDKTQIPAIAAVELENTQKLAGLNILTINETRGRLGLPPLPNGDEIMAPSDLMPLLDDTRIAGDDQS